MNVFRILNALLISARRLGPTVFVRHVAEKLATLSLGRLYVSAPVRRWRHAHVAPISASLPKAAIFAHAYYPELIGEILDCRRTLPAHTPIFITVPFEKLDLAQAAIVGAEAVTLIAVENRGRDIAPLLEALASDVLAPFEAVLKVHTKRSPHLLDGEIRRKLLFDLLANPAALALLADPSTGMVGWGATYRSGSVYWMGNRPVAENLMRSIGVSGPVPLGFFEGSMFWFRPAALAPLRGLNLSSSDFPAEAGQLDGTLQHALERLFTAVAWSGGYEVRDLSGRVRIGTIQP